MGSEIPRFTSKLGPEPDNPFGSNFAVTDIFQMQAQQNQILAESNTALRERISDLEREVSSAHARALENEMRIREEYTTRLDQLRDAHARREAELQNKIADLRLEIPQLRAEQTILNYRIESGDPAGSRWDRLIELVVTAAPQLLANYSPKQPEIPEMTQTHHSPMQLPERPVQRRRVALAEVSGDGAIDHHHAAEVGEPIVQLSQPVGGFSVNETQQMQIPDPPQHPPQAKNNEERYTENMVKLAAGYFQGQHEYGYVKDTYSQHTEGYQNATGVKVSGEMLIDIVAGIAYLANQMGTDIEKVADIVQIAIGQNETLPGILATLGPKLAKQSLFQLYKAQADKFRDQDKDLIGNVLEVLHKRIEK